MWTHMESITNLLSCVFTVLALVFTLYLWLLDHLNGEEAKFLEGKGELLKFLKAHLDTIKNAGGPTDKQLSVLLDNMVEISNRLEIVMDYRFWERGKQQEEFRKIKWFFQDSKYLISTIQRCNEVQDSSQGRSLVSIPALNERELEDIRSDYMKGLAYTIVFFENWR